MIVKIAVVPLCALDKLHDSDKDVPGVYFSIANSVDDALDAFHSTVPIKVLDDFEIDAEEDE